MNRKEFLKKGLLGTGGLALGGLTLGSCTTNNSGQDIAVDDRTYTWRMATVWGKNFPVFGESANLFADIVEKMSQGRMKIKIFGTGELCPAMQTFYATSVGTTEMGAGASYYWQGIDPAAVFFTAVPFGMNAQQIQSWLLGGKGEGYTLWKALYAKYNLVPFPAGNSGVQMGGWFNREINSVDDLKGLKMRIPGMAGKVIEKVGGAAINVPGGEIYTNLERGVIDATEWVGPYHDYKLGLNKAAKYYYTPGWHETGSQLEFIVNKDAYDELPIYLQEILMAASMQVHVWVLSEFDAMNGEFLEKIIDSGTEIRHFPPDVLHRLKQATQEVLADYIRDNPSAKPIYESYTAFQNKIRPWSKLTEQAYYNSIM